MRISVEATDPKWFTEYLDRRKRLMAAVTERFRKALIRGMEIKEPRMLWSLKGTRDVHGFKDRPFVSSCWTAEYLANHLANRSIGFGYRSRICDPAAFKPEPIPAHPDAAKFAALLADLRRQNPDKADQFSVTARGSAIVHFEPGAETGCMIYSSVITGQIVFCGSADGKFPSIHRDDAFVQKEVA